jgi:hypothetical protein
MKKLIALLSFVAFVGITQSHAQQMPNVDQRQRIQRHRIHDGVTGGELTRREAADARHDQRRIRRSERRAKADGVVTPKERARLHHKQNVASRELRIDKHDQQDRPRAN